MTGWNGAEVHNNSKLTVNGITQFGGRFINNANAKLVGTADLDGTLQNRKRWIIQQYSALLKIREKSVCSTRPLVHAAMVILAQSAIPTLLKQPVKLKFPA